MKSLIALVLAMSVAACSSGSASDPLPIQAPVETATVIEEPAPDFSGELPSHLVIVGDSIMAGATVGMNVFESDYSLTAAHLMADVHKMRVTNLSLSGQNMRGAMVDNDITGGINYVTGKDSAVWIELGANDFIWTFSTLDEYRARYTALLDGIKRKSEDFRVYCAVPLRASTKFEDSHRSQEGYAYEDYRQVVRDLAEEGRCRLVDTYVWFSYDEAQAGSVLMPDGLHLSGDGHSRYAWYMTLTLKQVL